MLHKHSDLPLDPSCIGRHQARNCS